MAKKNKSAYSDILFWNKKDVDNDEEISDNSNIEEIVKKDIEKPEINPTITAYVPFYNEKIDKFEMFTLKIDPILEETLIEREPLKYDNYGRCVMDMQQRYAKDYAEKLRQTRRKK
jgi:hypothetical protein